MRAQGDQGGQEVSAHGRESGLRNEGNGKKGGREAITGSTEVGNEGGGIIASRDEYNGGIGSKTFGKLAEGLGAFETPII